MKSIKNAQVREVRRRLIEVAGRTTQDLGLGRIVGQVLGCFYLDERDCSLDEICGELGLSKAAVSIATRHLESLGILQRVWKKGDRKNYYALVRHLGPALRKGVLLLLQSKLSGVEAELDHADQLLSQVPRTDRHSDALFIQKRVDRARRLSRQFHNVLDNPFIRLLGE